MAKSAKHKKLRKQEKAKTKLKGAAQLAKAQNVVTPTLKSKKILVREQLVQKTSSEDSYTKYKQTFQEVLTSLNHHNSNTKKEGLKGLEELVTSQNNVLNSHLDRILEKISALTYDDEGSVRKENLKVSEVIFARVTENQVKPFWNLMLMHLKCTLTSFNSVIRYSSLSFLQLLVSYFPNLVCGSLHTILPNLLGLISSSGSGKASAKNQQAVRLKVEISEKHSDIKERVRVLSLIATCLDLRNNSSNVSQNRNNNSKERKVYFQDTASQQKVTSEDELIEKPIDRQKSMQNNYLSLYYPWGYAISSETNQNSGNSVNQTSTDDFNYSCMSSSFSENSELPLEELWTQFIHSCLSILSETWVEVGPSNDAKTTAGLKRDKQSRIDRETQGNSESSMNKDSRAAANLNNVAVDVLNCIMNVMKHLIGDWSNSFIEAKDNDYSPHTETENTGSELWKSLRKLYGPNIKKYFLRWLPFHAVQDSQQTIISKLNLQLFYISAQLRIFDATIMSKFEKYLNWLVRKDSLDSEKTSLVLNILSCLHLNNVGSLTTTFICHALAAGHGLVVHNFLISILSRKNTITNEPGLVNNLSWDELCVQIMKSTNDLTPEVLKLLTFVSIRKLTNLKSVVEFNFWRFIDYCKSENTDKAWEETIRVFYYCNSLDTFISGVDIKVIPPEIRRTVEAL